jgi:hypothetical protein
MRNIQKNKYSKEQKKAGHPLTGCPATKIPERFIS